MGGWEDGRMGEWEDGRMGGWEDERRGIIFSRDRASIANDFRILEGFPNSVIFKSQQHTLWQISN
jgi:hypothetical protein